MSQQFYDNYVKEWKEEHRKNLVTLPLYDISSTIGDEWEYLPKTYTDYMLAKIMAQSFSASSKRGVPELWRVSRGNITMVLFLNGEEIVEND